MCYSGYYFHADRRSNCLQQLSRPLGPTLGFVSGALGPSHPNLFVYPSVFKRLKLSKHFTFNVGDKRDPSKKLSTSWFSYFL